MPLPAMPAQRVIAVIALWACLASPAVTTAQLAAPESSATDLARLLERAQVEDFLTEYYDLFGKRTARDFGSFYTDDGVLDVNGVVARGRKSIEDLYKNLAAASPGRLGKFHMLLSNPKIVVRDDTATADFIWTGVVSETLKAAPRIVEQGREHDELVKRDGRWYLKYRVITSDGGLPTMFEKTYKNR